jgi:hypothetical protein
MSFSFLYEEVNQAFQQFCTQLCSDPSITFVEYVLQNHNNTLIFHNSCKINNTLIFHNSCKINNKSTLSVTLAEARISSFCKEFMYEILNQEVLFSKITNLYSAVRIRKQNGFYLGFIGSFVLRQNKLIQDNNGKFVVDVLPKDFSNNNSDVFDIKDFNVVADHDEPENEENKKNSESYQPNMTTTTIKYTKAIESTKSKTIKVEKTEKTESKYDMIENLEKSILKELKCHLHHFSNEFILEMQKLISFRFSSSSSFSSSSTLAPMVVK